MEHMAIVLDRHHAVMEELLTALTSVGWRFRAGLGLGLDAQSKALFHGEWGGIRAMRERCLRTSASSSLDNNNNFQGLY